MVRFKIVQGPHLLFTGANGHKTFGIRLESLGSKEEVEDKGLVRTFNVNDIKMLKTTTPPEEIGLTEESFKTLLGELKALMDAQ